MGGRGASSASSFSNIRIMASLGAKYFFPRRIRDVDGSIIDLKLGSEVTGIKAIAGAGTNRKIDNIKQVSKYVNGSDASEWTKMRGTATIDLAGVYVRAELHWYSRKGDIRVFGVKVKRYLL